MELTLVILKPDCLERKAVGEVIRRFESHGLEICACKMLKLDMDLLEVHYSHILALPVFPKLAAYMQSGPVIALALRGMDSVVRVRTLVGPTDSRKADKGSIRGDLGEDNMRNVVHASDSPQTAAQEIKRFFNENEIFCQ